jgi:large subunit ribosomal protein L18
MKISKQLLSKIKNKNKRLKPTKYKLLKRDKLRGKIKGDTYRYRLSVYRSNENIYAQIIDDRSIDIDNLIKTEPIGSRTLVSCSTLDRRIKLEVKSTRTCEASRLVGKRLAELCSEKKIVRVVFDRGPYLYHGRVKALADGARSGGLVF